MSLSDVATDLYLQGYVAFQRAVDLGVSPEGDAALHEAAMFAGMAHDLHEMDEL